MMKKLISVLLCMALLLCAFGCAKPEEEPSDPTTTTSTTTAAPTMQYNIVTGLEDIDLGQPTRPVGVMISNDYWASRPQANIDKADMYVEIETEGAVTRIMAVFGSTSRMPASLTPVRSARTPFIQIANALDLVYVHCGASKAGRQLIGRIDLSDADEQGNGAYFWRDKQLLQERATEYTLTTGGEEIAELIKNRGYATTAQAAMPFDFGPQTAAGGNNVTSAEVTVSASETVTFKYDAASGLYTKYFGGADSTEKHVSLTGNPIQVNNVVVIYGSKYAENVGSKQTYGFDLASGTGKVMTAGSARDITYKLSEDGFTLYETDGSKVKLNTGKTYICVADNGYKDDLVLA